MILVPILGLSTVVAPHDLSKHVVGPIHEWVAYTLFVLALGHITAAVIFHFTIRRDKVLQRMLPGTDV
jgi:cytochrome b561